MATTDSDDGGYDETDCAGPVQLKISDLKQFTNREEQGTKVSDHAYYDELDSGLGVNSMESVKSGLEASTSIIDIREYFKQAFDAADKNDWKRMGEILQDCPSVIDEATEDGETLLHLAAWWDYTQLVHLLKKQSVDHWPKYIERKNNRGLTALHIAALEGYFEITKLLLNDQADVMALTLTRQTPLHFAVLWGHAEITELLVTRGAQMNAKDNRDKTPLYMATIKRDEPILKILNSCVDSSA